MRNVNRSWWRRLLATLAPASPDIAERLARHYATEIRLAHGLTARCRVSDPVSVAGLLNELHRETAGDRRDLIWTLAQLAETAVNTTSLEAVGA